MSFSPTEEQNAVVTDGVNDALLIIEAMAGSGKTSVLELLSHRKPGKGLYLAFNRAIADEAKGRFNKRVKCFTMHGWAFKEIGHRYANRLESDKTGKLSPLRIQAALSLNGLGGMSPLARAGMVRYTLDHYMYSDSDTIQSSHTPIDQLRLIATGETHWSAADIERVQAALIQDATRLWDLLWAKNATLPLPHDAYLKAFCLKSPTLPFDYVEVDEAQDLNPSVTGFIKRQSCQKVLVGDSSQQIYTWRAAVNALTAFDDSDPARYYLTQSFRFGSNIAQRANLILGNLGSARPIRGFDKDRSTMQGPSARLFRSNIGLFTALIQHLRKDQGAYTIAGGGKDMLALLSGVDQLVQGEASTHPDLLGFSHWAEFKKAAEQDGAPRDMQQLVKVVNSCPRKTLRAALTRGTKTKESEAEWVFSTAHKSKGREWVTVYLGDDFPEPDADPDSPDFEPEEARLAYVAITRAQAKLRGGQAMLQAYTDRLQRLAKRQSMKGRIAKLADTLRQAPPERQQSLIAELTPEDREHLIKHLRAAE